jgi:kojibiose phosphorylase
MTDVPVSTDSTAFLPPAADDPWALLQPEMDWIRVGLWESLFSLSNGRLGTRGSFEEAMPDTRSRPMTFMAGLYNALPKGLPELPVLPDWLTTCITLAGERFDLRFGRTVEFVRWLDFRRAIMVRRVVWEDRHKRRTRLTFARFLSLARPELAVHRVEVTPLDWSGEIQIEADLPVPLPARGRGSEASRSHWRAGRVHTDSQGVRSLAMQTRQTRRPVVVAVAGECRTAGGTSPGCEALLEAAPSQTITLDRFAVFRAGDADGELDPGKVRGEARAARSEGFAAHLAAHEEACRAMWERMDVEIDGPVDDQRAVRFNLFHLAALCPPAGDFASIGPKGLAGTHYLGHIFWDTEIYMIPFFSLTHPEGARTLLEYRVCTLDGARRKAAANGYRGAQYAWESADTGDEACPRFVVETVTGERVRIWCGDIEDHITADVAYAIDQYVRFTGDLNFLWGHGAEVIFETARFWSSRISTSEDGVGHIRDCVGPDEFHEHVDDDALTNYLAHWNLLAAADLYDDGRMPMEVRKSLVAKLGLTPDEPEQWRRTAAALYLPYDEATGLVEESAGFFQRPEISPDLFRVPRRGWITEIIGPALAAEAQVLKQAEVIVAQYLFEDRFDQRSREANFDYYEPRTSHDSSLSPSSHAMCASRLGRVDQAYDYFRRAAYLDLEDLPGNTAAGLHTANMGGVWMTIVFGFAGLDLRGAVPSALSRLPATWSRLRFPITHHGRRYRVDCRPEHIRVDPV